MECNLMSKIKKIGAIVCPLCIFVPHHLFCTNTVALLLLSSDHLSHETYYITTCLEFCSWNSSINYLFSKISHVCLHPPASLLLRDANFSPWLTGSGCFECSTEFAVPRRVMSSGEEATQNVTPQSVTSSSSSVSPKFFHSSSAFYSELGNTAVLLLIVL